MAAENGNLYVKVRVLHAACYAPSVQVMVGSRVIADGLSYAMDSGYSKVMDGFRQVSVINQENGEEILSDTLPFSAGRQITLVICNTMNSISLVPMEEFFCNAGKNRGCVRIANFSFNDGPFDVLDADGNIIFSDIMPKEITQFLPAEAGDYEFKLVRTGSEYAPEADRLAKEDKDSRLSIFMRVMPGCNYTACILGACASERPLEIMTLEF